MMGSLMARYGTRRSDEAFKDKAYMFGFIIVSW